MRLFEKNLNVVILVCTSLHRDIPVTITPYLVCVINAIRDEITFVTIFREE